MYYLWFDFISNGWITALNIAVLPSLYYHSTFPQVAEKTYLPSFDFKKVSKFTMTSFIWGTYTQASTDLTTFVIIGRYGVCILTSTAYNLYSYLV